VLYLYIRDSYYIVSYPVIDGGATQIERYCDKCVKTLYAIEQVL
jgi:hypothetical protein